MVDVSTVSIAIASVGVLAAAIYYSLQVRNQAKMRQIDLVMRLYSTFGSENLQKAGIKVVHIRYEDYDDFVKKYGEPSSEEPVPMAIIKVLYFFEEVGVLLRKKLIDIELVEQLFGYNIMWIGAVIIPLLKEARKRVSQPRIWENFEYLYNEMKKRDQGLQRIQH